MSEELLRIQWKDGTVWCLRATPRVSFAAGLFVGLAMALAIMVASLLVSRG